MSGRLADVKVQREDNHSRALKRLTILPSWLTGRVFKYGHSIFVQVFMVGDCHVIGLFMRQMVPYK
jgi:hypothetical protein